MRYLLREGRWTDYYDGTTRLYNAMQDGASGEEFGGTILVYQHGRKGYYKSFVRLKKYSCCIQEKRSRTHPNGD